MALWLLPPCMQQPSSMLLPGPSTDEKACPPLLNGSSSLVLLSLWGAPPLIPFHAGLREHFLSLPRLCKGRSYSAAAFWLVDSSAIMAACWFFHAEQRSCIYWLLVSILTARVPPSVSKCDQGVRRSRKLPSHVRQLSAQPISCALCLAMPAMSVPHVIMVGWSCCAASQGLESGPAFKFFRNDGRSQLS